MTTLHTTLSDLRHYAVALALLVVALRPLAGHLEKAPWRNVTKAITRMAATALEGLRQLIVPADMQEPKGERLAGTFAQTLTLYLAAGFFLLCFGVILSIYLNVHSTRDTALSTGILVVLALAWRVATLESRRARLRLVELAVGTVWARRLW